MKGPLGIIVNPFSGRDVRRVAARASTSDHLEKQQQVTRLVLGALSRGVDSIFLADEPFRINERAVENLPERGKVRLLNFPLTHTAADTLTMARLMWAEGCRVFIVLGGDGTSRVLAGEFPDATLLPLSTGTNNVFPCRLEASIAGIAAGLVATGLVDAGDNCKRCKRMLIEANGTRSIALIDAVLLRDDAIGSLLPFAPENLVTLVLTRAEPAAVGVSPIGGYLVPCGRNDDFGVQVDCFDCRLDSHLNRAPGDDRRDGKILVNVPISPGLHVDVGVTRARRLDLGETIEIPGPGILAFDGDRSLVLDGNESARLTIRRDGPRIIETEHVMQVAAARMLLAGNV